MRNITCVRCKSSNRKRRQSQRCEEIKGIREKRKDSAKAQVFKLMDGMVAADLIGISFLVDRVVESYKHIGLHL